MKQYFHFFCSQLVFCFLVHKVAFFNTDSAVANAEE
jgi:hypothetical protein